MQNTDVIFKELPKPVREYIAHLEARVAKLERQVAEYQQTIAAKDKRIDELENKCERLQFQNAKLIADKYGTTSEKITPIDGIAFGVVDDNGHICDLQEPAADADQDTLCLTDEEIKAALDLTGERDQKKPAT